MYEENNPFQIKYIKTKNKLRKIVTYKDDELRLLHQNIASFVNEHFIPSKFTKAYVKNKSIYHNAISHMYNDIFISLDIKNFFNNINHKLLVNALYYELNKKKHGTINKVECGKIVSICSISKTGLPLGLITSPILSNVYLKEFDNILYGQLKKLSLTNIIYTRYADDLVVSFKETSSVYSVPKEKIIALVISLVERLLKRYKLKLNNRKTQIINFDKSNHVKITGVNINRDQFNHRTLTVGRKLKNDLFHKAIEYYESNNRNKIDLMRIKGLESFILSIEKKGYDRIYSANMKNKIRTLGYNSLHELIKSMKYQE